MPRVEIEPQGYDPSDPDGTPTIDVCASCISFFEDGEASPLYLQKHYPESGILSVDVDHPPYDDDRYFCHCCGNMLTNED